MHNYKQRLNNSFLICIGLLILFVTVNFLSLRNYYYEMFNPYYFVNNDFEEKLKKENSSIDKSYENENSTVPENEDPKRIKLNSLAALLMDAENNRVL